MESLTLVEIDNIRQNLVCIYGENDMYKSVMDKLDIMYDYIVENKENQI